MKARPKSKFAPWQEANQTRREALIDDFLKVLGETRVRVKFITSLADLVARHITQVEGKPCNTATILRNVRYKAKLLSYQANCLVSGSAGVNRQNLRDPVANLAVVNSELVSGNLRRELERLQVYVTSLEEEIDQLKDKTGTISKLSNNASPKQDLSDFEFRFVRTCQALRLLLNHLNLVIKVDPISQQILDLSKRSGNVIVDKEIAGPFFEWLAVQGDGKMHERDAGKNGADR